MGFWSSLFNRDPGGITPNVNPSSSVGAPDWNPGDPEGVVLDNWDPVETRALPKVFPSPWSGWPAEWNVPNWDFGSRFNELVDVAWGCLDLNSRVLSSMPVYRTRDGRIVDPAQWMTNPDPMIYTSWHEFAKQLFWDYQCGEAFVLSMARLDGDFPLTFRVVPPWLIDVTLSGGTRVYRLGGPAGTDVTGDILHIRYKSTTDSARGVGPLESAGGRMLTAGILAKYVREVASTGGVPAYTLETDQELEPEDAQDMLQQWVATRAANLGYPPVLDNNVSLKTHMSMTPKDMAMLELSQFNEGRIVTLLGVPAALMNLPSGDSFTYSNVSSWFDHHDRSALRPFAADVMAALSGFTLPPSEHAELNRDEYTRPPFNERAGAWVALKNADLVTTEQFQAAERLMGPGSASALTGANGTGGEGRDTPTPTPREIAEMIQKIYLGVGVVITAQEARAILNRVGAGLNASLNPTSTPLPVGGA